MIIETEDLRFAYGRRTEPVITKQSIALSAGSVVGLSGQSGSGKSTLLFLLALLLRPTGGIIRVEGEDVTRWSDRQRSIARRDWFGFIFQDAALDPTRSVLDNITEAATYGASTRRHLRRRAIDLLDRFEVDVPPRRRPGQISGGQAQRIALCRALVTEPSVIFADEPTASLDSTNAGRVISALRDHAVDGGLVVVASHDPSAIAACDTVIAL